MSQSNQRGGEGEDKSKGEVNGSVGCNDGAMITSDIKHDGMHHSRWLRGSSGGWSPGRVHECVQGVCVSLGVRMAALGTGHTLPGLQST